MEINNTSGNRYEDKVRQGLEVLLITISEYYRGHSEEYQSDFVLREAKSLSSYMNWYVIETIPMGHHFIENEEEVIRKAVSKVFPCLKTNKWDSSLCGTCIEKFQCWTCPSFNHVNPKKKTRWIRSQIRQGIKGNPRIGYQPTIEGCEEQIKKNKRKLSDLMGGEVK
ncbi:MAG: hypothetical protein HQ553_04435 [Chloroflexi bacterium]|nr:hypothetical protein [Chloroflexota bacterium]